MFNWGDLQIVYRFFYEFFKVLGITWLIVVFAAIVTQGRIGQYGTFILPTQFLIALGFGIFKIINGQQQHFNSPDRNYSSSDSPKNRIHTGSKYPYLNFYCGLIRVCAYFVIGLCFIALALLFFLLVFAAMYPDVSDDPTILIERAGLLFQVSAMCLGALAFAGIIQVLMDIEENTRNKS
jgi:hypothetical protein